MRPNEIIAKIKPILITHGVSKADLFGSAARGDMGPDSDVDVLVRLPEKASLFDLGGLYMDLKDALGTDVDVVEYAAVHPYLKDYIFSNTMKVI